LVPFPEQAQKVPLELALPLDGRSVDTIVTTPPDFTYA